MFAIRTLLVALASATALANPLEVRQNSNTNPQIIQIVDSVDQSLHVTMPNIITLLANHGANDTSIGEQVNDLVTTFNTAAQDLGNIPVSSGSTTVSPTNDDISIFWADGLAVLFGGLSGLTTDIVPSLPSLMSQLDPAIASANTALNTTLPGSLKLVHTMMLDAQQFAARMGLTQARASLGFT